MKRLNSPAETQPAATESNIMIKLRRGRRVLGIAVHLAIGVATVLCCFPFCTSLGRHRHIQGWSKRLLRIMGLRIKIHGQATAQEGVGHIYLANHVSWLDIYALFQIAHLRFVAKSEVASWPVIGWLSRKTGTLFIERAKSRDAYRTKNTIQNCLQSGEHIAIFPEGTTSNGQQVKAFRAPLLQAAIDGGTWIQPVLLRYTDENGQLNQVAAYVDDMSLGESIWQIISCKSLNLDLYHLPAIKTQGMGRRELAQELEEAFRIRLAHLNQSRFDRLSGQAPG